MSEYLCKRQGALLLVQKVVVAIVLLTSCIGLMSCGKKAGQLNPPSSVTTDTFPMTYPDTSTDPKPQPNENNPD